MKSPKKHYYIIKNGRKVGDSWAVSPQKAVTNWWWKYVKCKNEYSPREYGPDKLDAIEA